MTKREAKVALATEFERDDYGQEAQRRMRRPYVRQSRRVDEGVGERSSTDLRVKEPFVGTQN